MMTSTAQQVLPVFLVACLCFFFFNYYSCCPPLSCCFLLAFSQYVTCGGAKRKQAHSRAVSQSARACLPFVPLLLPEGGREGGRCFMMSERVCERALALPTLSSTSQILALSTCRVSTAMWGPTMNWA